MILVKILWCLVFRSVNTTEHPTRPVDYKMHSFGKRQTSSCILFMLLYELFPFWFVSFPFFARSFFFLLCDFIWHKWMSMLESVFVGFGATLSHLLLIAPKAFELWHFAVFWICFFFLFHSHWSLLYCDHRSNYLELYCTWFSIMQWLINQFK